MKILVIEDYEPIRTAITQGLREAGFAVDATGDGEEGLWFCQSDDYDALILDLMLPKVDGLTILCQLCERQSRIPVLILTAKDTINDRVCGLDSGADDYLVKPFAFDELLARVRALIRRKYEARSPVIRVGDLEIDTTHRTVHRAGRSIMLRPREFVILEFLAHRAGQVVSRAEIWEHVYDFAAEPNSNVIDVHIGHLRRRLEQGNQSPLIHTQRGLGYVLGERA